ncbi:aminotransferase class I/II-fold pyridoxal phosphate-dependent enzyme [Paenibacillus sp. D2_2]|uniref:aminotransferase class I/II-fold pyridoxal phosphate-dependent enzyme n=1 Tax=Paenibacillus sp. D2_2 TaxID=3073092 RepID=UPI0035C00AD5
MRDWLASAYRQAEGGERAAEAEDRLLLVDSVAGALELAISALLKPGDAVLVESPSSPEALWMLRLRGAVPVPVQCDRDGMLPDDLRRQLRAAKPALVYVTPLHSTGPSGAVWSQQRMLTLLEQCDRHRVPIVEDGTACGCRGSRAPGCKAQVRQGRAMHRSRQRPTRSSPYGLAKPNGEERASSCWIRSSGPYPHRCRWPGYAAMRQCLPGSQSPALKKPFIAVLPFRTVLSLIGC